MNTIPIGPEKLLIATGFIFITAILSMLMALDIVKSLFIASLRTILQLLTLGYLLFHIFAISDPILICFLLLIMIFFASWTTLGRVKDPSKGLLIPTFYALLISGISVTFAVTGLVIQVSPWSEPRYLLPLAGMIIGNSMNGISISLNHLFSDFRNNKARINALLALGASPYEATKESIKISLQAGLIPTINSMNAAGIVFIPGMMTGQILAGADPVLASLYQIIVMLMLSAATAIGSMIAVLLSYKKAFNSKDQFIY